MSNIRHRLQFKVRSLVLLLTIACLAVGIFRLVNPPETKVLVAKQHLDVKTKLSAENTKYELWPTKLVPEGAITSGVIPVGKFTTSRIRKGQFIPDEELVENEPLICIPAGWRVVLIKLPVYEGSSGILSPGDIVDVTLSKEDSPRVVLFQNVRVFNVGQGTPMKNWHGAVGLLVKDETAVEIEKAKQLGQIELILRHVP